MRLFGNRKKTRNKQPRKDTTDSVLEKALVTRLKKDPELAFRMATKKFNLEVETPDDIEAVKSKILAEALKNDPEFALLVKQEYLASQSGSSNSDIVEEAINDAVLERIQSDPKILERAVTARVASIASGKGPDGAFAEFFENYRAIKTMEEEMGGGKKEGIGDFLVEVGKAFAPYIPALLLRQAPPQQLQQLAEPRITTLPPPQESTPEPAKVTEEVKPAATLDIAELEKILQMEPIDFATQLMERAKEDNNAKMLLAVLTTTTADDFIKSLEPYKDNEKLKPTLEKLQGEKKVWLEEVIELLKSLKEPEK